MFPNPQEALPLPVHPDIEQYRKLAKDLVKACRKHDHRAIGDCTNRWIAALISGIAPVDHPRGRLAMDRVTDQVEEFATRHLEPRCQLAEAQFVIARSHGFPSWPRFAEHLDRLAHAGPETAAFEAAADAIVSGDEATLQRLLDDRPRLVGARSTREHNATLLHYVSANGVEGYRQKTPKNIVRIAVMLLDAGADVDAECDVYGGGATTLGLVATSGHPRIAGVQLALLQLLIDRGARIEHPRAAGNESVAVMGSLANGCPEAAAFLAAHGARLDLVAAAGVGRLDVVRSFFDEQGRPEADVSTAQVNAALRYAAFYGSAEIAKFLLERGADIADSPGDGQTAMHRAVMGGHIDVVRVLLEQDPPLEGHNQFGGTVLGQALWSAAHGGDPDTYVAIIDALLKAGARLREKHVPVNEKVDAFLARHGSLPELEWHWLGEEPRR